MRLKQTKQVLVIIVCVILQRFATLIPLHTYCSDHYRNEPSAIYTGKIKLKDHSKTRSCFRIMKRQCVRPVYDFETPDHLSAFAVPSTSSLQRSTAHYKDGSYSMKWTWSSGDTITHHLTPEVVTGKEFKKGGMKLWIYNTHKRTDHLTVSFEDTQTTPGAPVIISRFQVSLNFKGWRAIWVSYSESRVASRGEIDTLNITAPTSSPSHPLYFDILRLVGKLKDQTRDKIVPTMDAGVYTLNNLWQQTFRWSQAIPHAIPIADPSPEKLADLILIEKRLDNWFVKQDQSSLDFDGYALKRWKSLQDQISEAYEALDRLKIDKSSTGDITGVPLFGRNSEYNGEKFGYVMHNVLLPLALDYHIRSRAVEVNSVASRELSRLNNSTTKTASIERIAGTDSTMQMTLSTSLGLSTPYTEEKVKEAINTLNDKRKDRLMLLLEYIDDQGFSEGSGLGSLDHEMNKDGAGFMNSVYLLRKVIRTAAKLPEIIATMKWYNEFGEVYQETFDHRGTTADRMRTISLYRLFTVLMMPTTTALQQHEKLRDMEALLRWYNNALLPNEGLAGLLKPDYLGFHHNGCYASAYVPSALHTAAFIKYLLSGTSFALGQEACDHLKKGLETMRILAVKYSFPNSVLGRFPGFSRADLSQTIPAYAYIAAMAPNFKEDGSLGEIKNIDPYNIKMFLRLYDTAEKSITAYLQRGNVSSSIFYLNTIGSIYILQAINREAIRMSILAEPSPKGFWAKNYASLVIQRRADWAVSVKGFNRHVWDFEASHKKKKTQNVYGLYQSHGALLIANSEEALKSHDIDNGWDWTRHPGTTTIKMDLEQLVSETRRHFQPNELAGGLVLIGGGDHPNGIFGMDFTKPRYQHPSASFQLRIDFKFRKSVFFADHYIICLGSGITSTNSAPHITQTTLFQNKLVDPGSPSSIHINSKSYSLSTDHTIEPSFFRPVDNSVSLMDTNGNGYFIRNAGTQGLCVKLGLQTSKNERGKEGDTFGRYATAWLDHGINPTNTGYEYAVLVNATLGDIQNLAARQASFESNVYEVLRKDNSAHVVQVNDFPRTGQTQYGYVVFEEFTETPGPVVHVTKGQCLLMVEEVDSRNLYIAVSSPHLNLNFSRTLEAASEVNADERFFSSSQEVQVKIYLREAVNVATEEVKQDGKVVPTADKAAHVEVKPGIEGEILGREIVFKRLVKGFTTEVKLTR